MRKNVLALLLLLLVKTSNAQSYAIDSLKQRLQNETRDTTRSILFAQLSYAVIYSNPDSALLLAQQGLAIAKSKQYARGETWCLNVLANAFRLRGNNPKALELFLQALKKAESINYTQRIGSILSNIGIVYSFQGDLRKSLEYYFRAKVIDESLKDEVAIGYDLLNLGDSYEKLNILDSARYYTNLSYNMAMKQNDPNFIGFALNNLGNTYSKMGQNAIALEYYRSALPYLYKAESYETICESTLGMAKLFQKMGQADSCLYYAKLSLLTAEKAGVMMRTLYATNFLADYYKTAQNVDSAYAYMSATIAAKDSLFSQEKTRELQSLSFDESMRQMELTVAREKAMEERRTNIQYGIIAITLVGFIIIFLLLTNSVIVNEKWIKFLGILGLLLLFEFINLFIHPYLAELTHHSPIFLLLVSVVIASLLIPLHHKIEHWVTHRMVDKNKRLRLAEAKKVVAALESELGEQGRKQ